MLLAVSVLGLLLAPFVAEDRPAAVGAAQQVAVVTGVQPPRSVEPRVVRPGTLPSAGQRDGAARPIRLAPIGVGVATMNMYRDLSVEAAADDARRLTSRPGVDVVGWQEAEGFGAALRGLPGWRTRTFVGAGGEPTELAVSWRSSQFRLVGARLHKVALGLSGLDGRYPFPARYVAVARLEHRATGRVLTVINTHLPQKIEDTHRPGRWLSTTNSVRARAQLHRLAEIWGDAPGRWVVGTGDFNFGARADARERPPGGPLQALRRNAVSSYQVLGSGVGPTHTPTARNIDYVWADRAGVRDSQIALRGHTVLSGYRSDHRPLLVRMRLS